MSTDVEIIKAIREFGSAVVSNTKANMAGKAGKPSLEQRKALNLLRAVLEREPLPEEINSIVGLG